MCRMFEISDTARAKEEREAGRVKLLVTPQICKGDAFDQLLTGRPPLQLELECAIYDAVINKQPVNPTVHQPPAPFARARRATPMPLALKWLKRHVRRSGCQPSGIPQLQRQSNSGSLRDGSRRSSPSRSFQFQEPVQKTQSASPTSD